jgi:outer membrane protein OmpA-like peptidoglycan-associated protein
VLARLSLVTAATLMMLASPAFAQPGALGLRLDAVVSGKQKPAIVLEPSAAIKKVSVTLTRDGARKQVLRAGRVAVGKIKRLAFKSPVGVYEYNARFEVSWGDGSSTDFTTAFKVTRVGELVLSIGPGDVDMEARRMVFRITNPVAKAELVLLGERGRRIGLEEVDFNSEPPGSPLELTWSAPSGGADIVRMDLKVTDIAGFWTGMQITPFSIEIPHDELEFASGKANVRAEEAPKLERTLGHVKDALAKHGTLLALKFYVAGYTDTVGNSAYNRELSNRRARSIAAWFRSHGLKIPIHYCGFGEGFLAKQTPDETDEPANRRAIYILTSQAPAGSSFPGGKWKRL